MKTLTSFTLLLPPTKSNCYLRIILTALRVKILMESYNTTSHERFYVVRIKGTFKPGLHLKIKERIWATNAHACKCPDLLRGKDYVIMGNLQSDPGRQEPRLTVQPRSFVREWKRGMKRRLDSLNKFCKREPARR